MKIGTIVLEVFMWVVGLSTVFLVGYILGIAYPLDKVVNNVGTNQKNLDGLYLGNWLNEDVKDYAKSRDPRGDWVCSNVRGMTYERCVEVAAHECGHELFAEKCEDNPKLCFDLMDMLEK